MRILPRVLLDLFLVGLVGLVGGCSSSDGEDVERSEHASTGACSDDALAIGAGTADVTGPAAEMPMMGYVRHGQTTAGIHMRLRSRAFVFASSCTSKRVAFVSVDVQGIGQGLAQEVHDRLRARFGGLYGEENVMLSATHTHAGPGGHHTDTLYALASEGFDARSFDVLAEGIVRSIARAHEDLGPAKARVATGELAGASINRSPQAYALNPAEERARYAGDVETQTTLVRIERPSGAAMGALHWFGVHGTSMGNDNRLISGDNKGWAAAAFEKRMGARFVAAFAQEAEGDVSPNVGGGTEGGGADDFASTAISGTKQLGDALSLWEGARAGLGGAVDFRQAYVKMDAITLGDGRRTCLAALGVSMVAGAEDGPGIGHEGMTLPARRTECQGEKPIVLETGTKSPPWTPEILPIQILRIGRLAIVGVPFELTTMAGRRLRATVAGELAALGVAEVVVGGLANAYAGYVTTREEYGAQHYEGASTHFGPWTLAAIQEEATRLARAMRTNQTVGRGPRPSDRRASALLLSRPGVIADAAPLFRDFGDLDRDARASYRRGETVSVAFWGAHLANDLRTEGTFLAVEKKTPTGWETIASDGDLSTKLRWERVHCAPTFACSRVTVEWTIDDATAAGAYRVRHFGAWKSLGGRITPFEGASRELAVE